MAQKYKRLPAEEILSRYGLVGIHEAARLLPPATDAEFQALCGDVQVHGFIEAVERTPAKLVLDGLTRLQVASAFTRLSVPLIAPQ
jgi:hypothetical protein